MTSRTEAATKLWVLSGSVFLWVGCSDAGMAGAPSSAPSASSGAAAPATSATATALSPIPATKLARKATPSERFDKDQKGCDGGDAAACVSLAHRFAGTGIEAGCGVPRQRAFPTLKRIPTDDPADWQAYQAAVKKACDLGDKASCHYVRADRPLSQEEPRHIRYAGVRRDPSDLGIWVYAAASKPEWAKGLADAQKKCADSGQCRFIDFLFKKVKAPADGKLTPELAKIAEDACAKTHDCDDIYMMLDKDGYTPEELAPVRASFAKSLSDACVEGECTCGEATKYLGEADPARPDLAILGCQNGEAEGCFGMARLYDQGVGVEKDPVEANALYDVACPSIVPSSSAEVPVGDYSAHACDHYAEIFLGGPYPGKDRDRGIYYADLACRNPGNEFDNAPCVRRGLEYATKRTSTGHNGNDARQAAWGDWDPLSVDNECSRPSVKAQCAELKEALKTIR